MSISRIRAESQLRTLSEQLVSVVDAAVVVAVVVAVARLDGLQELDSQQQQQCAAAGGGGGGCSHTRTLRLRLE
jgi:hypothetical protein